MSIQIKSNIEIPQEVIDKILEDLNKLKDNVFYVFDSQILSDQCDGIINQLQSHSINFQESPEIAP
jgi:hypothetical protein